MVGIQFKGGHIKMPFDIPLLFNILQGLGLMLLIVLVGASIMMTPKVVKYYVDSKIFIKSQQIKRLYDDEQNKFKKQYTDDHLLKHPNEQIAKLAKYSDYTLKKMCQEQQIKDYNRMNKYDKIVALLKAQGIEVKEESTNNELLPDVLNVENKNDDLESDDPNDEPNDEADIIEEEDTKDKKEIHPVNPTSIETAKEKRRKELDKLSNKELNKIAGVLKIKYASKIRKAKLIDIIIDKEIEASVEAEGDAVKGFKQLEEGK